MLNDKSPYLIEGPAQICFSGGRTSAYMLRHILDANGGLPQDVHVTFQNTGKEMPQTLEFIDACAKNWNVPVRWLEWDGFMPKSKSKCLFKEVDFNTASRDGEPFDKLTSTLGYLPNPTQRVCTAYLKVKTGKAFMESLGYDSWDNVMGIRADEPSRISRMRNPTRDNSAGEPILPLASAGVTSRIVGSYWENQKFDLGLRNDNGITAEGNCDLCFLKGSGKVLSLIRKEPERAIWWIGQEDKITRMSKAGKPVFFRNDRPSYAQMHRNALNQERLFPDADESLIDCMCGD